MGKRKRQPNRTPPGTQLGELTQCSVSAPGALCVGPRHSLAVCVGPRRSITQVGARRCAVAGAHRRSLHLCVRPRRSLCRVPALSRSPCRGRRSLCRRTLCVGPGALRSPGALVSRPGPSGSAPSSDPRVYHVTHPVRGNPTKIRVSPIWSAAASSDPREAPSSDPGTAQQMRMPPSGPRPPAFAGPQLRCAFHLTGPQAPSSDSHATHPFPRAHLKSSHVQRPSSDQLGSASRHRD